MILANRGMSRITTKGTVARDHLGRLSETLPTLLRPACARWCLAQDQVWGQLRERPELRFIGMHKKDRPTSTK